MDQALMLHPYTCLLDGKPVRLGHANALELELGGRVAHPLIRRRDPKGNPMPPVRHVIFTARAPEPKPRQILARRDGRWVWL